MSKTSNKRSAEVRTRVVRMALEYGGGYPSCWAAVSTDIADDVSPLFHPAESKASSVFDVGPDFGPSGGGISRVALMADRMRRMHS